MASGGQRDSAPPRLWRDLPSLGRRTMTASDSRNIVLTGFMGTGKTTVGRLLAEQLGYEFVDTDLVIEQRHGKIADVFRTLGEAAFRRIERELAAELSDRVRLVISTGGRMMLDPQNVASLSRNGRVFCLVATPDEIFDRVTNDPSRVERPLLSVPDPRQRIVELLAERSPDYRRFAQLTTDTVSADAVAADLVALATFRSSPFCDRQPERRLRVRGGRGGVAVRSAAGPHRRPDGGRHQRRGGRSVPFELRRRRPHDHAAQWERTSEEPGGGPTRRTTRCSTPTSIARRRSCRWVIRSSVTWRASQRRRTSVVSTSCTALPT